MLVQEKWRNKEIKQNERDGEGKHNGRPQKTNKDISIIIENKNKEENDRENTKQYKMRTQVNSSQIKYISRDANVAGYNLAACDISILIWFVVMSLYLV